MSIFDLHLNNNNLSLCPGHLNNSHCLAKAINALAGAMFTIYGPGDLEERLKEFLAVSFILHDFFLFFFIFLKFSQHV